MAADDIYRVTAQIATTDNDIFQWVWHYLQTTGADIAYNLLADEIIGMLDTAFAQIVDYISDTVDGDTLEIAKWDGVNSEFNTEYSEDISTHLNGTAIGARLPNQDAMVVKFFTDYGQSIGKKFISGYSIGAVNGQAFSAGRVTEAALFAADFNDDLVSGAATFTPGNFNVSQVVFRPWSGTVEALSLVRTQDRRIRGVGL